MVFRGGRRGRGDQSLLAEYQEGIIVDWLPIGGGGWGGVVIRILQSLWKDQMNFILTQQKSSFTSWGVELWYVGPCSLSFYLTFWFESCSRHISALDRFNFLNTSKSSLCQNLENKWKLNNISSNSINFH